MDLKQLESRLKAHHPTPEWSSNDSKIIFGRDPQGLWFWEFLHTSDGDAYDEKQFEHNGFSTRGAAADYIENLVYPVIGKSIQMQPFRLFTV